MHRGQRDAAEFVCHNDKEKDQLRGEKQFQKEPVPDLQRQIRRPGALCESEVLPKSRATTISAASAYARHGGK